MARRKRRKFTAKFKSDAARLVTGGKTVAEVTEQFDLTETALREWVTRAEADAGKGPPDALTTAERAELIELRKRLKRVEMERDIFKKATFSPILANIFLHESARHMVPRRGASPSQGTRGTGALCG
jgi:transposase